MVEQIEEKQEPNEASRSLWTWDELASACRTANVLVSEENGGVKPDFSSVQIDSRLVQPGDLFVALAGDPGDRFHTSARSSVDGHDFVAAAIAAGAQGAVVQKEIAGLGAPLLWVTDTYDALWAIGRAASERCEGPKLAVTGSSGKTTAKTMLQAALGGYASPGSFNNHIGVPLSLANAPREDKPAVFEVGTSSPGEIEPLANLVRPDVAMVLNVGSAHAENFSSRQALFEEKISIFRGLSNKSNAIWEYSLGLENGLSFGRDAAADVALINIKGDAASISICGDRKSARVPGGGEHRALTLCGVLACCVILGEGLEQALSLAGDAVPIGRGNRRQIGEAIVVDDSYNANPDSMEQAIKAFLESTKGRKVLILGEMLELGEESAQAHAKLARDLVGLDVVLVGAAFEKAASENGLAWRAQADETLLAQLESLCREPVSVLIKGSNRVFWQQKFVDNLAEKLSTDDIQ